MSVSVASVTVARNSARILPRQMEALLQQTHPLREIIVVDNASADGTASILAKWYPQVTVLNMADNLGAAGAWAAGMSYAALRKGHEWVWTFDDDSVPQVDALARLLGAFGLLNGLQREVGVIVPMPVHRESRICYPPLLWRDGFVKPNEEIRRKSVWFADLVIASGSLVRKEVVEKIGLPRADFFMDFFDFEYSLRARSQGFRIGVIPDVQFDHVIGGARKISWFGGTRLWTSYAPWREYYNSRNLTYAGWHLYPSRKAQRFVLKHLLRHMSAVLLFSPRKLACLRKMIQGFWDGKRGRLGIRFQPSS